MENIHTKDLELIRQFHDNDKTNFDLNIILEIFENENTADKKKI